MSSTDRAVIQLGRVTPGDFRDEEIVRSWARDLAGQLARKGD
jgi:hypothetical protein